QPQNNHTHSAIEHPAVHRMQVIIASLRIVDVRRHAHECKLHALKHCQENSSIFHREVCVLKEIHDVVDDLFELLYCLERQRIVLVDTNSLFIHVTSTP